MELVNARGKPNLSKSAHFGTLSTGPIKANKAGAVA